MASLQSILNPIPLAESSATDSRFPRSLSSSPTSTTSPNSGVSPSKNRLLTSVPPMHSPIMDKTTTTLPCVFSRTTIRDSPADQSTISMAPPKGSLFSRSRPRGHVKYPPYEHVDEASLREIQNFSVFPFGRIEECCAHIPYNSGKKDFFEKTGRESFEGESVFITYH
jgi:hypothetical protein